jgi:hypothetical protein
VAGALQITKRHTISEQQVEEQVKHSKQAALCAPWLHYAVQLHEYTSEGGLVQCPPCERPQESSSCSLPERRAGALGHLHWCSSQF